MWGHTPLTLTSHTIFSQLIPHTQIIINHAVVGWWGRVFYYRCSESVSTRSELWINAYVCISSGSWGSINYIWLFVLPRSYKFVRGFRMSYLEPRGFLILNLKLRVLKIPYFEIMGLIMPYHEPRVFRMSYPEHVGFRTSYYWTCGIQNILLWTYGIQIISSPSYGILNIFLLKVWDSKYRYLDHVRCRISYLNVSDSEYLILKVWSSA